ncbi:MAG: hypothetical protein QNJ02_11215, partial [Desulfobacterales bacterium]|nr:hypothetical protein [Desulfobacterales bacterium]
MTVYRCTICDTLFDEDQDGRKWDQLADDWACAVCDSGKAMWQPMADEGSVPASPVQARGTDNAIPEKHFDEIETAMADIHTMAATGESIIEPMRTRRPSFTWDDILIMGA